MKYSLLVLIHKFFTNAIFRTILLNGSKLFSERILAAQINIILMGNISDKIRNVEHLHFSTTGQTKNVASLYFCNKYPTTTSSPNSKSKVSFEICSF